MSDTCIIKSTTDASADQLIELTAHLERVRALAIVESVGKVAVEKSPDTAQPQWSIWSSACREVALRLRTEAWGMLPNGGWGPTGAANEDDRPSPDFPALLRRALGAASAVDAAPAAPASVRIDFKMATELLAMFGGEPGEITLKVGIGHDGEGLYAWYSDYPEEGAENLGMPDDEAAPAAASAAPAPSVAVSTSETACREIPIADLATLRIQAGFCDPGEETSIDGGLLSILVDAYDGAQRPAAPAMSGEAATIRMGQIDRHLDEEAVDVFAAAMKRKLSAARDKGRGGWQHCPPSDLSRMLREHVEKGDPTDVANFAMFLWNLGAGITHPSPAVEPGKGALSDAELDAFWGAFDWEGWTYPVNGRRAFARAILAKFGAPAGAEHQSWAPIETAPQHEHLWLFSPEWIDLDFNPSGTREGQSSDDSGWMTAWWHADQDCWQTLENQQPTHWMRPFGESAAIAQAGAQKGGDHV